MDLNNIAIRIASPILIRLARFFVAVSNDQIGKLIKKFLKEQYEEEPSGTDALVGAKVTRSYQNREDAEDNIQDLLRYLTEKGHKLRAPDANRGLHELISYLNMRRRSQYRSNLTQKRRFPSEEDIPEEEMERAESFDPKLDDKSDILEFMDEFQSLLPDLLETLNENEAALFDVIFNDEVGSFSQDIKQNMGQGSAFRDKYPNIYEKNQKRWSGFVGDTRKKLFEKIQDFMIGDTSKQFRGKMREMVKIL